MPARHLFVTRGDLTALHCDAWVLPTDRHGNVTTAWRPALERLGRGGTDGGPGRLDDAARAELEATGSAVLRPPTADAPGVVACDTGVPHGDVRACARALADAIERLEEVVADADVCPSARLELPRPRRLVALPTVGVGAGGVVAARCRQPDAGGVHRQSGGVPRGEAGGRGGGGGASG
ncbi:MAG: hypothetical protein ITG02_08805, partial [Patulibacter sp.]|nr:hypothetical protein [Patulibacter sp.]